MEVGKAVVDDRDQAFDPCDLLPGASLSHGQ
jgi:hypothetical protein